MSTWKRAALALAVLGALVAFGTSGSTAGKKQKRLRAEVAELKARIAQLESQTGFLMRRDVYAAPASPGGLCADPCALDSDGDGRGDCEDPCPCDPENRDADADGAPDCVDPCPGDATDACIDPCRMDSDADGTTDCEDPCPYDPAAAADGDADGIPDCADPCPEDPANDCVSPCPLDADGDGTKDCVDPCPWGAATGMPCIGVEPPPPPSGGCTVSGCSAQICADEPVVTTCEWHARYACYRTASCARQADGQCGWTLTDELKTCLDAPGGP